MNIYLSTRRRQVQVERRYGRWKVLSFARKDHNGNLLWNCRCDCGTEREVRGSNLLNSSISCGCHKSEVTTARNLTHGLAHLPEYNIWLGVKSRCVNVTGVTYSGRKLKLCRRWLKFENFMADMGSRPTKLHTIERVNNELGYCPRNCIWATRLVQSRNRRNVPVVRYKGKKASLAELSATYGMNRNTLTKRLRHGWSLHEALTKPIRPIKGVHY